MSSFLKERFSHKESIPYESERTDMTNSSEETERSDKEENLVDGRPSEKNKWLLILAVHFCNVMYSACYWINIGVYPVRNSRDLFKYEYLYLIFNCRTAIGSIIPYIIILAIYKNYRFFSNCKNLLRAITFSQLKISCSLFAFNNFIIHDSTSPSRLESTWLLMATCRQRLLQCSCWEDHCMDV